MQTASLNQMLNWSNFSTAHSIKTNRYRHNSNIFTVTFIALLNDIAFVKGKQM